MNLISATTGVVQPSSPITFQIWPHKPTFHGLVVFSIRRLYQTLEANAYSVTVILMVCDGRLSNFSIMQI